MCHNYIQSSFGKAISKFNFSSLFSQAWLKTCLPTNICSGFEKAGIIPFNPDRLLKRCPGTEGTFVTRLKKKSECSEEILTDPHNFQSSLPMCPGANVSSDKEYLFQGCFEEGYDLYDEEYFRWLESNHPDLLPNQVSFKQNDFPSASSLVHGDNDRSMIISSPQSLSQSCIILTHPMRKKMSTIIQPQLNQILVTLLSTLLKLYNL